MDWFDPYLKGGIEKHEKEERKRKAEEEEKERKRKEREREKTRLLAILGNYRNSPEIRRLTTTENKRIIIKSSEGVVLHNIQPTKDSIENVSETLLESSQHSHLKKPQYIQGYNWIFSTPTTDKPATQMLLTLGPDEQPVYGVGGKYSVVTSDSTDSPTVFYFNGMKLYKNLNAVEFALGNAIEEHVKIFGP
jgi:hypothetical protein